jgi:hypothetical protein
MYKMVGADQREYGPVTSDQVREWIAQGRANGQTLASFEGSPWKPLSTYPEFADALRTVVPPPVGQPSHVTAGGPSPYPGARTNTASVSGLVLCILGTCCSPLSVIGLILCVVGLIQIQNTPQQYTTTKVVPIIGIIIAILDFVFIGIAIASGALEHIIRNFPR